MSDGGQPGDELRAAADGTAAAFRQLGRIMQEANGAELAQHPDLAELNVMLDGFYR